MTPDAGATPTATAEALARGGATAVYFAESGFRCAIVARNFARSDLLRVIDATRASLAEAPGAAAAGAAEADTIENGQPPGRAAKLAAPDGGEAPARR